MEILTSNWAEIILAVLAAVEIFTLATPSKTDDRVVGYVRAVVLALKNRAEKRRKND
tara:strand:+ start:350 stop:520 length:171 start_codon:yes stop_codon:yes gene_type:complete